MKETNYWNRFYASGRIEDYLAYSLQKEKSDAKEEGILREESVLREENISKEESDAKEESVREFLHAGILYGDRNGDKPDACR